MASVMSFVPGRVAELWKGLCRRWLNGDDFDKSWFFFWCLRRISWASSCWCCAVSGLLLLFINADVFKWGRGCRSWLVDDLLGARVEAVVSSSALDSHLDGHRIKRQTTHRARLVRLSGCHRRRVDRQRTVLGKRQGHIRATMLCSLRVVWSNLSASCSKRGWRRHPATDRQLTRRLQNSPVVWAWRDRLAHHSFDSR